MGREKPVKEDSRGKPQYLEDNGDNFRNREILSRSGETTKFSFGNVHF